MGYAKRNGLRKNILRNRKMGYANLIKALLGSPGNLLKSPPGK